MARGVFLSSDRGDIDDQLVTDEGVRVRDTQLVESATTFDWTASSVASLRRLVMGQDASNAITASASNGNLALTATSTGGNQHEAWLLPDSLATDSEMDSVIGMADSLGAGVAQWGNIHAIFQDAAGLWHGAVCWTDTTIPVPTLLNFGVVTFANGSMSLNNLGNNPIGMALDALRYLNVLRAQRASNVVTLTVNSGRLPPVGSTGSLVTNADATFHITSAPVTAVDMTKRTISYAQTAANATDANAGGTWQPDTKWATTPFRLRSRLSGNVLSAAVYHQEEGRPDWSDTTRVHSVTLTGGSPAFLAGEGFCGLWVAHLETPNVQRYGQVSWRRLS